MQESQHAGMLRQNCKKGFLEDILVFDLEINKRVVKIHKLSRSLNFLTKIPRNGLQKIKKKTVYDKKSKLKN